MIAREIGRENNLVLISADLVRAPEPVIFKLGIVGRGILSLIALFQQESELSKR
jgi:hypothetical protein